MKVDTRTLARFMISRKRPVHLFRLALLVACILVLSIWYFLSFESFPGHEQLNAWMLERLVSTKTLPDDFDKLDSNSRKVIYVLGGSEDSLTYRFIIAARLYKKSSAQKILIFSRPGITGYDPLLRRNLTNNEWAMKRLVELGVRREDIELLFLGSSFFGTLREARGVSQKVMNRGYDILILISSPYHTKRVYESFSKYLADKGIDIYVYASEDRTHLIGLLGEYFKLILYETLLLMNYPAASCEVSIY
jgi:uncharacterized SAM-binding protein YcdF (DUF218 family)